MTRKERADLQMKSRQLEQVEQAKELGLDPERMPTMLAIEMCSCGHRRVLHHDAVGGLAKGHGDCAACDCMKFTWVSRS